MRCWFCHKGDEMSAGLGGVRCLHCGEFTDPATGGPWVGSGNESPPSTRSASPEQIAAWVAPEVPGRVPNPHGPVQRNTGLHGQPVDVPSS